MSAQIIDDFERKTLAYVTSASKTFAEKVAASEKKSMSQMEKSALVGRLLAEQAKERGVTKVVFDRKGYTYHGCVKALAEAARSSGLQF